MCNTCSCLIDIGGISIELRHLRYFIAVAEELHFTRAARRLHVAQPPLSQVVRRLEKELDAQLLRRTSRRVELTDAGRVFLEEARRTVAAADRSVEVVQRAARGQTGWLRVGFVESAAYELLPRILPAFMSRSPGVQLELHELTTEMQLNRLASGDVDVGLVREVHSHDDLVVRQLLRESLVVALPRSHWLAGGWRIRLHQLDGEQFVLFPRSQAPRLHDLIAGLCRAAGFVPRAAQEAVNLPTILGMVAAGIGVAVLPAAVTTIRWSGVVYVPIVDRDAVTDLAFVHAPRAEGPVLDVFAAVAFATGSRG